METVAQQRAGAQRSGTSPLYQVLAEDIVAMGVEAAFGLISDDTALLATALDTSGARFYGARHENCAIAMADGYAYAAAGWGWLWSGADPRSPTACMARFMRVVRAPLCSSSTARRRR